ncbi:MAG TPA: OmpA family protein [Kofleriaceae bacterium]
MSASSDESGIVVYPRLPVPSQRGGGQESRQPTKMVKTGGGGSKAWIALLVIGVAGGGAGAWFLRPMLAPDPRIAEADRRAGEAADAAATQKKRADALEQALDSAAKGKQDAEAKLTVASAAQSELAGKTASEASQRQVAEQIAAKLRPGIDRSWGQVTIDGDDVHVQIADRVLWKPNDDALTAKGQAVLAKLATSLKDVGDRQVWIQGHTDDQPMPVPKALPPPAPSKRGQKPAPPPPPPPVRFATNWELSAARALSVVHYFQDTAKLEPGRLTALAFGQYAPVSKKDRSANRRLELVLVARRGK